MSRIAIELTVLGGGQSIGKSCFLLSINKQHILLDCGSYVGKDTKKALPDFSRLPSGISINDISAVLISHFHIDHIGGLVYLTEALKYSGDIYASSPTRAIMPLILHNNRVLISTQSQSQPSIDPNIFVNLTKRIKEVGMEQSIQINDHVRAIAHIAGHVLGAIMWEIIVDNTRVLYTGDYSDEDGGFLLPYQLPKLYDHSNELDMLIMETTYGNTTFSILKDRQKQLESVIVETFEKKGRVLIPCYGIGYTQELIAFIQQIWAEHHFNYPIYYSSQDTKATLRIFELYHNWESHALAIDGEKLQLFRSEYINYTSPYLLLATQPTMLSGVARTVFNKLALDSSSSVVFLGNNGPDTYSGQMMKENAHVGDGIDKPVVCRREIIPFSAHPDRKANVRLIERCSPSCVVLIHGDKSSCMGLMKYYLKHHTVSPTFLIPENGKTVYYTSNTIRATISRSDLHLMEFIRSVKRGHDDEQLGLKIDRTNNDRSVSLCHGNDLYTIENESVLNMDETTWMTVSKSIKLKDIAGTLQYVEGVNVSYQKERGLIISWNSVYEASVLHLIDTIHSCMTKSH